MDKRFKFCNFRPFVLLALATILSVVFAVFIVVNPFVQFIVFLLLLTISVLFLILFIIKKCKIFRFLTALFLCTSIPFLTISFQSHKLNANEKFETKILSVLGKVSENYEITENGYLRIVLNSVEISDGDTIHSIDGKIAIYTAPEFIDSANLKVGTYIYASLELDFSTLESNDKWELAYLSKNIVAMGFASQGNIKIYLNNDLTVSEIIKSNVFDVLKESNMKHSDLAYAMMFGDTNVVDLNINNNFRESGIAHILAVSGLHISAIVFAISFILKKLKVSRLFQIVFLFIILLFYVYLCDFSISAIRAGLMALVLNYSYLRGKAYDNLSVLAMLATFILLISPLQLFSASFVLSFLSVLSIILLKDPLARIFDKIFYKKLSSELALLFSLQLGITIVTAYFFETMQPLSFLANLISIPIVTFAFIVVIVFSIASLIIPFLSVVCLWIGELFNIVAQFVSYIKGLSPLITVTGISVYAIPIVFVALFLISDYCFMSKKIKGGVAAALGLGYVLLFFI